MDDLLVRYLLDDLPPADRAAVAGRVAADPAAAARLARLRRVADALAADRDFAPPPPPGLALAAIARTAEVLVAEGWPRPDRRAPADALRPLAGRAAAAWRWVGGGVLLGAGRRADAVVAAAVAVLAVGVGMSAVGKLRHENRVRACQDNLRELHTALAGYSDVHAGRFPQVGTPAVPVAGALPAELVRAGQLRSPAVAACPVADPDAGGYAYTLGYRGPAGQVVGLRRAAAPDGAGDWVPVAADPVAAPHKRGLNVLFVGGGVRFANSPAAGPGGDDIYRNDDGLVRAGLHRLDSALGTATDIP